MKMSKMSIISLLLSKLDDIARRAIGLHEQEWLCGQIVDGDRLVLWTGDGAHSSDKDDSGDCDDDGHGGGLDVPLCFEGTDHTETPLTRDCCRHKHGGPQETSWT
ncbi:uncharacterized protein LOC112570748 [Pomacea canaliculata]|uniref:uncharacterized protein LOC112570748 n=1 Tax=Pomacea canaliculata TaxID=400727 RepID=UPI000D72601C|nr:uncharacterized protein LOC112570748 [Pomacea canaliculata]